MLSIQEVHSYNILVEKGFAEPMNCPFNEEGIANHIILSELNKSEELVFRCLTCDASFQLGLNTEDIIKRLIKQHFK